MTIDNNQMERDWRADQDAGNLLRTLFETCDELLLHRRYRVAKSAAKSAVELEKMRDWAAEERARLVRTWD